MKLFTNLPRTLRVFFGFLRTVTIVLAVFWLLLLTLAVWLEKHYAAHPNLSLGIGEISLRTEPAALAPASAAMIGQTVKVDKLRTQLTLDIINGDQGLVSAVRWSVYPAIVAGVIFAWMIFGLLRNLCANIERGEIFSEKNLRLIRWVGSILILYGCIRGIIGAWASYFVGQYLSAHCALIGLGDAVRLPTSYGAVQFTLPTLWISYPEGFVVGGLVLLMAEVFRQGLALKTETDLTV